MFTYLPRVVVHLNTLPPPLDHLFDGLGESYMILRDVNAHSQLWYSEATNDIRGNALADTISGRPCGIINKDLPTRVTNLVYTAPDITIVSSNLIPYHLKSRKQMSSDHLPITISLTADLKKFNSKNANFINFSKANWPAFQKHIDKRQIPTCKTNEQYT